MPLSLFLSLTLSLQLLRLKRSFAFMRSKSVENFFQRSYSDARLPSDFISDPPPPSPPMLPGSPLPSDNSAILSPSVSPKPSLSPSPVVQQPRPMQTHCFLEHVFRRPSSCQLCKHVIVGNSKQGLRCKTCKIAAHLWCTSELSQQTCYGKTGMFKRNYSSPLLVIDQLGPVRESQPAQGAFGNDPVYATLRYGTSLAQMSRSSFGSMSESPTHSLVSVCVSVSVTDSMLFSHICSLSLSLSLSLFLSLPLSLSTPYSLSPGDRVQVTDDSNEEWWKGKSGNKVGFFPANFVQRVRPGESVWRVTQGAQGNRQLGHMAVKEDQICVGKKDNSEGFLKLHSGKKRGLVPAHSLEEI
uniref:SH3 and cysteine rich domain 2 n=1 Tax=Electrophorus electricus TaxID=8005 RepID=A0A4W4GE17_ELEEL